MDVLDVRVVGFGLMEQQLSTTLCVTNPGTSSLAFRRVTVALDVSAMPLAVGASDLAFDLPPLASRTVPFTVVTTLQNLGPQILDTLRSGILEYRVHGTVTLQGAFGLTVPYSRSGHLNLLTGGLEVASAAADPPPSLCSSTGVVPSGI